MPAQATHSTARWLLKAAIVLGLACQATTSSAQEGANSSAYLVTDREDPGPTNPPKGRSLFDQLFADQNGIYNIPYPFEDLIADLNARIAPAEVRTAMVPLGRSLQRYAAHPDYFESPRIVVAVDQPATNASPGQPALKDRLYLGYQPAGQQIEVLSYNEAAGRFEFQKIEKYRGAGGMSATYENRQVCTACHQAHAPIFSTAPWAETNGNKAVSAALTNLGETFYGAPVKQGIDGPDFFDQSTDRANRIAPAQAIWDQGCATADEPSTCRAQLLLSVLAYRLSGARALPPDPPGLRQLMATQWPNGIWSASPDLVDRDPMIKVAAGAEYDELLETDRLLDPTAPRDPIQHWQPNGSLTELISLLITDADIKWLDKRLAGIDGTRKRDLTAPCTLTSHANGELRFSCDSDNLGVEGFLKTSGGPSNLGRIDGLRLQDQPLIRRLAIAIARQRGDGTIHLTLNEKAQGLNARSIDGRRLGTLVIDQTAQTATLQVIDDMAPLTSAISQIASDSLGDGPINRAALFSSLDQTLP